MVDKPNFIDWGDAEPFPIFVTKQPDERAKRLRAVTFARASVGLEGFTLSEIDEENAKMDLDEFLRRSIPST